MAILRKSYTLSYAVELIGVKLYADQWTESDYSCPKPRMSPDELEQQRLPRLQAIEKLEREKTEIDFAILKTLDADENRRLARAKRELEAEIQQFHFQLGQLPDPTLPPQFREPYYRYERAKSVLFNATRAGQLRVHNGRGADLNLPVWQDHPRFHYDLERSLLLLPEAAGFRRWTPARIYEVEFDRWLETLTPIVPLPQKISIEEQKPSIEELVKKFFERKMNAEKNGAPHQTRASIRQEAMREIPELTGRRFDQCWAQYAYPTWRAPGAPKKKP